MKFKDTKLTKTIANRTLALLLSACMIGTSFGSVPLTAYASQGTDGLCEHHTAHDSTCGYSEATQGHECGHVHDSSCGYQEAHDCNHVCGEECGENGADCTHTHNGDCGYQEASSCSHSHNGDCGYSEGSEGSSCTYICTECSNTNKGDNGEGQGNDDPADDPEVPEDDPEVDDPAEEREADMAVRYIITAWEWIDEEEIFDPESGALMLSATEEAPCMFGDVAELLPMQIRAEILAYRAEDEEDTNTENPETESESDTETDPLTPENTTSMDLDIADWVCEEYPEEGAYKGSYTFTASLPEGYELSEDVKALEVEVLFDAPQVLAEGRYTDEGFCEGYSWVDGVLAKNTGEGETMCSHGDTCNGYQPAEEKSYDVNGDATTGADEKAFEITNAGQLYWFAAYVNEGGDHLNANAYLANDITVNKDLLSRIATDDSGNVTSDNGAREWVPIGDDTNKYAGVFDGNNQEIKGIYINKIDKDDQGLFGSSSGEIKNLTVKDSKIIGRLRVGGIAGANYQGKIVYCFFDGEVIAKGFSRYSSSIAAVGGIAGGNGENAVIENCTNSGTVTGYASHVGGICGSNGYQITNCINNGTVTMKTDTDYGLVGGICGSSGGGEDAEIIKCTNNADVITEMSALVYAGGICGKIELGSIKNCANNSTRNICGDHPENYIIKYCYTKNLCIYGSDCTITTMTSGDFASGKVAYLLNQGQEKFETNK